jgi:hypothetical protein
MLGGGPPLEGRSRRRRDPSLRNGVCLLLFVLLCSPSHLGYNALGSMRLVDGANSPASAAPLRVYVVPHSHCDPGWWKTVDEYFADWAEGVISSAVETLSENKERRFIWSEISFFRLWWDKVSAAVFLCACCVVSLVGCPVLMCGFFLPLLTFAIAVAFCFVELVVFLLMGTLIPDTQTKTARFEARYGATPGLKRTTRVCEWRVGATR